MQLQHCQPLGSRPNCIPKARARGSAARGLTYERKVGKYLKTLFPNLKSGVWFQYQDGSGPGYCQPDHFVKLPNQTLLVECKLSEKQSGYSQMLDLYRPILEQTYGLPVTCVLAARHIVSRRKLILDVRDALATPGEVYLWHHLT